MEQRSDNLTATNSTSSSDRRSNLLAAMLCICALMYVAAWLRILPDRETHTEFSQFYVSALLMRNHQDTYNTDIHAIGAAFGLDTANIEQANYPPTFLMMFEPLTLVRPRSAFWIWTFVNVVALAISLWMLLRPAAKYGTRIVVSMLALSLIYPPVTNHFYYSQSKILLLLMLTAMMLALERRHDLIAGVLLALGTLWLMFPIALFGYLILSRRWRAVGWGVGGIIALAGLTILVVGARNTVSWRNGIGVLTDSAWYSQSTNVAIGSFVSRTFWDAFGPMLGPRLDRVRRVSSACAQIAILVLACIPLLKNPRRGDPDARVFCLWIVACVRRVSDGVDLQHGAVANPVFAYCACFRRRSGSARCDQVRETQLRDDFPGLSDRMRSLRRVVLLSARDANRIANLWYRVGRRRHLADAGVHRRLSIRARSRCSGSCVTGQHQVRRPGDGGHPVVLRDRGA
jgi:Glycosyltransferase family 87